MDQGELTRTMIADWPTGAPTSCFKRAPRKPKVKRKRREPTQGTRAVIVRDKIAEWEVKERAAHRAWKLARTKLRSLRASMRGLERELAKLPAEVLDDETLLRRVREAREAKR